MRRGVVVAPMDDGRDFRPSNPQVFAHAIVERAQGGAHEGRNRGAERRGAAAREQSLTWKGHVSAQRSSHRVDCLAGPRRRHRRGACPARSARGLAGQM